MHHTIHEAMTALDIPSEDLSPVRLTQYQAVLSRILQTFTTLGARGRQQLWLWEHLKGEWVSVGGEHEQNLRLLPQLVAAEERIWFITEDWDREKKNDNSWVFEGKAEAVIAVLDELHAFEYYLAAKDYSWLICENHHDVLIGLGEPVKSRLQAVKQARQ